MLLGKYMNLKLHVYICPCKGRSLDKFHKLIKKKTNYKILCVLTKAG